MNELTIKKVNLNGVSMIACQSFDGKVRVGIRSICDGLGVDYAGQMQRIQRDDILPQGVCKMPIPSLGGVQEVNVLEIDYLPFFLTGIKASMVRPEIAHLVKDFKLKAKDVLAEAFVNKVSVPRNDDEIILLGYQKLMGKVQLLEGKVAEMEPKALFADSVSNSKNSILIADLAKILKQNGIEIGEVRLFKWMRDNGYLGKQNSYYNKPTQKAMELGLFHIKETTVTHSDGRTSVSITPKVTGKGQIYFVNKFCEERNRLSEITASNI